MQRISLDQVELFGQDLNRPEGVVVAADGEVIEVEGADEDNDDEGGDEGRNAGPVVEPAAGGAGGWNVHTASRLRLRLRVKRSMTNRGYDYMLQQ